MVFLFLICVLINRVDTNRFIKKLTIIVAKCNFWWYNKMIHKFKERPDMEQEIKKLCSSAIHKRGTEYFRSGRVHIKNRENQGFTAVVDDDGIYNVRVACDDNGNITDYFCTCPYYETMGSVCKHIVASCMERDREIAGTSGVNDVNERISRMLVSDFSRNLQEKLQFNIRFELSFIKTANTFFCEISFFVNDKLIDNPEEFLECYTLHKGFNVSKKINYHPDTCFFGEYEETILSFLAQSTESRMIKNPMYYKSVNSIVVGSECIKHIMPYLSEVDYKIIIDRMDMGRALILKENPEILIDISAMLGEINLYVSNYGISIVPDGSVFFYEGAVYLTDKEWQSRFVPIYNALSEDYRSQITFKGETALSFATFVLPELEKAPGVVCDGLEEFIIKAEPKFYVYIDYDMRKIKCKIKALYGEVSFFLPETKATDGYIVVRNIELEEKLLSYFCGFVLRNGYYVAEDDEEIYKFLSENIYKVQEMAEVSVSDNFKNAEIKRTMPISATVNFDSKTQILDGEIESNLTSEEIREILLSVKLKKPFYRTEQGQFYDINALRNKLLAFERIFMNDNKNIPVYNLLYLYTAANMYDDTGINCSSNLVKYVEDVLSQSANIPKDLKNKLRPYQITGADWLHQLSHLGLGGILADDMGLGKTVQMIAFLAGRANKNPVLIVTPSALTYNWKYEFKKFLPEASVLVMDGSAEEREEKIKRIGDYEYIIVSYALLRRDIEQYINFNFSYCILDEAQAIKNPHTMSASAVKRIKAQGRFALTGTPIENSMKELWSIFDFLLPGYLGTYNSFRELYESSDNDEGRVLLKSKIKPFLLRRMKKEVLSELPEKIEEVLYAKMTDNQSKLYSAYKEIARNKALAAIAEKVGQNMEILTLLLRLRQISCHPELFDSAYVGGSGKLDLLYGRLETAIASGHRVLVFSQFTSMLELISKGLDERNINYFYIDGSTPPEKRIELCNRFNDGENDVFLISLKAGGTGLNLTGADTVIHYDPWWNPAVTDQASDRAYRIGQKRNVHVIRLVSAESIEEKIIKLQESKKELADDIININNTSLSSLTSDELFELFE